VATFVEFPPIETRVLGEIAGKSSCPMRYVGTSPLQAVFELGAAPAEKMAEKIAKLFRGFEDITLTPPKAEPSNPLFQDTNILN
jgi:transcription-repair coupling factor (superfamily II helicase)